MKAKTNSRNERHENPMTRESGIIRLGRPLLAGMLLVFSCQAVANPTGAQIVKGAVQMNSVGGQLTIHNSPNAIINWQNFSISRQEITRFIQENGSSAVLNRVIGQDPSQIMGKLLSNGHVFLINPNGVVFGANAVVDTAGLVASSLNLSDDDFLSGNYQFSGDANSGDVINRGLITAGKGGEVVLIAPTVENSGVISVEDGNILLAAGERMTLSSLDLEGIEFEVQAPHNKVMNLGKLLANGGSVGVFAGSLSNTGVISANSVRQGANGELWLEASDSAMVSGELLAGDITITADDITLSNARIDASGTYGGGQVRIGGDYQGAALAVGVSNAQKVTVDANTTIQANALEQGNGGRVIIWSDENTQVDGHISATGGSMGGDGGFVETSGKKLLDFANPVDVSASNGKPGTWLIDPEDITIDSGKASSIETALNNGSSVSIKTSDSGSGEGNITVASSITKTQGGDASLSLTAHNKIDVNAPITSTSNKLDVRLRAGSEVNINANISTNGGSVSTGITGLESEPVTEPSEVATPETPPGTEVDELVAAIADTREAVTRPPEVLTGEAVPAPELVISVDTDLLVEPVPATRISATIETLGGDISVNAGETGLAEISGVLNASNLETDQTGGNIDVLGDQINLTESAALDASGDAGGGTIRVGGDYQGEGDALTASYTSVAKGATIKSDAITEGDGGKVIVWSDDTTVFHGNISATGGEQGGDGGFAEVSGKQHLLITGHANLGAVKGEAGTLLLDPGSVNIEDNTVSITPPSPEKDTFYNGWITYQLDGDGGIDFGGSNLVISTAVSTNGASENINVNADVWWSSNHSLTLNAGNDINVGATITNSAALYGGGGTLELSAGGNNNINQEINLAGGGGLKLIAGGVNYVNDNILMEPGSGSINAMGGNGIVTFNSGNTVTVRASDFDARTINVYNGITTFEDPSSPATFSTNDLNQFGGTIGGSTTSLDIYGLYDWRGGHNSFLNTTVSSDGSLLIQGGASKYLDSGTLRNESMSGSNAWRDTGWMYTTGGGSIENAGRLVLEGDTYFYDQSSAGSTFSNSGTLIRTAEGTNIGSFTLLGTTFNNSGTLDVQKGEFRLHSASNHSGTVNVASGATLGIWNQGLLNTHNLNLGTSLQGSGLVQLGGTSILKVNTDIIADPGLDFKMAHNGAALEVVSGKTLTIEGLLDWSSGIMQGAGTTAVGTAGQLLISGTGLKRLYDGTLRNESASSTWTDDGTVYSYDGGSLDNAGTLQLQGNGGFRPQLGSAGTFTNSGSLIRNTGTGTFIIDRLAFNNSGTVDVQTGILKLGANSTHSGNLNVASGATLQLGGYSGYNSHDMNSGSAFTGNGTVELFESARLKVNTPVASGSGVRLKLNGSGVNIEGPGALTVNGILDWVSGDIEASSTTVVSSTGQLLISGNGSKNLRNSTLRNESTSSTWVDDGTISAHDGGTLENVGTLQLQGDGSFLASTGNGFFTNSGTLTRNTSTGTFLVQRAPFTNSGTVDVQTGILKLQNNSNHSGGLNVASGATLQLGSSSPSRTHDLNVGTSLTGDGTIELVEDGLLSVNTAITSGSGLRIKLSGNDYNAGLGGSSNLTVNGILDWQSGAIMGSGTTTVSAGGQLLIGGAGTKYLSIGTLRNESASSQWLGNQYLDAYSGAVFENIGTLELLGDTYFQASGATFTNSGTLIRNASTDAGLFRIVRADFNNTGTIDVQKGIFRLETNSNHSGVLNVADGATLQLGSWGSHTEGHYVHTINTGTEITGSGTLEVLDWGELNLNTDLSTPAGVRIVLNNSDAGISGNRNLTVNGLLELSAGELRGSGTTTVTSGGQLLISGNPYLANGTLRNESDSSLWTGTWVYVYDNGTFENAGTLQLQGKNGGFYADTAGNVFDNSGLLIRNTRPGAVTFEGITFNNSGSIDVQTGSLVMIQDWTGNNPLNFNWTDGTLGGAGDIIFDTGANLNISGSGARVLDGLSLTVDNLSLDEGSLEVRSGTLNATGITTISDGTSLNMTGGDLNTDAGAQLNIAGILGWSAGQLLGDGELDIADTGQFDYSAAGPSSVDFDITNANVFNVSNGALNVVGSFDQSGGTTTINAGGSLDVSNGYSMTAGTTQINGGGTLSTDVYTQNGGTTAFIGDANGSAALNASTSVNFNSGNVTNVGTITSPNVNVGAVTLAPGFSPGTMNIAGNLTLSSSTILDFEVGPNASAYDILNVSGLMDFGDATMNLSWYGGYVPTDLDSFQVVNYASHTGSLSTVNAPVFVGSNYQPGSLLLTVNPSGPVSPPAPPPPDVLPLSAPQELSEEQLAALVYAASAEIVPVVTTIIEDAISQWPYDPSDLRNSFVLTGAVNGGNGDRLTVAEESSRDGDSSGRGQKVYINGDGPGIGLQVSPDQMCN